MTPEEARDEHARRLIALTDWRNSLAIALDRGFVERVSDVATLRELLAFLDARIENARAEVEL